MRDAWARVIASSVDCGTHVSGAILNQISNGLTRGMCDYITTLSAEAPIKVPLLFVNTRMRILCDTVFDAYQSGIIGGVGFAVPMFREGLMLSEQALIDFRGTLAIWGMDVLLLCKNEPLTIDGGKFYATALNVTFPTDWHLGEKA